MKQALSAPESCGQDNIFHQVTGPLWFRISPQMAVLSNSTLHQGVGWICGVCSSIEMNEAEGNEQSVMTVDDKHLF